MMHSKKIIDSHIHIWDLTRAEYPWLKNDLSILNRSYHITELESERMNTNVSEGILVQASGNIEDTELMLEVAANTDWIRGVVGWLPLLDPVATYNYIQDKYLAHPYFKGVRHQIHDEINPSWLLQTQVIESLKIIADNMLPFDVVGIFPEHLDTILKLGEKTPNLKMVLDHLNQPPIASKQRFGKWGELIIEVSKNANIFAKISGLGTASGNFEGRRVEDILPYVDFAIEHFGIERCFCGGDWPVSLLASNYAKTWNDIEFLIESLVYEQEASMIFYDNAKRFYKL